MDVILIDENIPYLAESLRKCGKIIEFSGRALTNEDICKAGCTALFVRSTTKVNKNLLVGTEVKFVGTATSGIDHIDLVYLNENNIHFAYAPGSNANSVAEYIVYSILKWSADKGINLKKCKIGIIGFGNIGKIVAEYSNLLGIGILVNDPPLKGEGFEFPDYAEYTELDYLFSKVDIITNHVPFTKSGKYPTIKLINEKHFSFVRNDSLLIHTSRGGVVYEKSLLSAMRTKNITAAIDVWENEPLINKELALCSMLATPHIAGYSFDGKLRGVYLMAEDYSRFSGSQPDYSKIIVLMREYKPLGTENFNNTKLLLELLTTSRKISSDTDALLKTLDLDDVSRAKAFDALRKSYPKRREIL